MFSMFIDACLVSGYGFLLRQLVSQDARINPSNVVFEFPNGVKIDLEFSSFHEMGCFRDLVLGRCEHEAALVFFVEDWRLMSVVYIAENPGHAVEH